MGNLFPSIVCAQPLIVRFQEYKAAYVGLFCLQQKGNSKFVLTNISHPFSGKEKGFGSRFPELHVQIQILHVKFQYCMSFSDFQNLSQPQ